MALLLILLVAAFVRVPVALHVPMWWDEIWSMWQTQGGLGQTIAITPYDWPPLYYVVLWAWSAVVGHGDVSGRALSICFALGTVALLYGAGRAMAGEWVGRLAALLFAVLPYPAYVSLEARGYALLLLLASALAWVHVEWLRRPSGARATLYAVLATAAIYTSYTGILVVGLLLTHAALATAWVPEEERRRHLGRLGAVVGLMLVLLMPIATWLASIARLKWKHIVEGSLRPEGFDRLPSNYAIWVAGGRPALMGALVTLALAGLAIWWWRRPGPDGGRLLVLLLMWGIGAPVGMHLFRHQLHLTSLRYVVYALPGLVLAIGAGLGQLPTALRWLAVAGMLLYASVPLPVEMYRPRYSDEKPTREAVRAMARTYQPGEAVLIDPRCQCGRPVEWEYWEALYYPGARTIRVTDPRDAGRRVWYWADQRGIDGSLAAAVSRGRLLTRSFGDYYMRGELYEAPPRSEGVPVGPALRYHGHDFESPPILRPGDRLRVRLWWSVTSSPVDHVFELAVLGPHGERLVSQVAAPSGELAPPPTSRWEPGRLYADPRGIRLPRDLHGGTYAVQLAAIQAAEGAAVSPGAGPAPVVGERLTLGNILVYSYN